MRQKILSAFLALCMVLTILPTPALAAGSPVDESAKEVVLDLDNGDITVTVDANGVQTASQGTGQAVPAQNLVITGKGMEDYTITVETNGVPARFTLRDLTTETSDRPTVEISDGEAEITIAGDVDLSNDSAPVFHVTTGSLTLLGEGTLTAYCDAFYDTYATMGGGVVEVGDWDTEPENFTGSITIGGSVTAVIVNGDGPAIGAGGSVSGSIHITDEAVVEVTSNGNTAIGSGAGDYSSSYPMSGSITIDGSAEVTAESGGSTAIGSGDKSPMSGTISIGEDATVIAVLVGEGYSAPGAAAIGSGEGAEMSGNIFIGGNAAVQAQAISGAGVGSGKSGQLSGRVVVREEATVDAQSGSGAGIGSGDSGDMMGSLEFDDQSNVLAAGLDGGAGIGSGHYGEMGGDILISDNANIQTKNAKTGAGIGSGESGAINGYIAILDGAQVLNVRETRNAVDIGAGDGGESLSEYSLEISPTAQIGELVEYPAENGVRQLELRGKTVVDQKLRFTRSKNNYDLTVLPGSSLEIAEGAELDMAPENGAVRIINQGKILNNGVIRLTKPADETVDLSKLVRDMHLEGLGHVAFVEGSGWSEKVTIYSNSGETAAQTTDILNFTTNIYEGPGTQFIVLPNENATLDTDGYQLSEDGKTLTIKNLNIQGLILPSDMTLVLKGSNSFTSNMRSHYVDDQWYSDYFVAIYQPDGGSLTITTEEGKAGYLEAIHGSTSGAENLCNADTLVIDGDAQITGNILSCGGDLTVQGNTSLTLNKNLRAEGDMVMDGNANVYVAVSDQLVGYSGGYPVALYAQSLELLGGRLHLEGAYEEGWSSINKTMALLLASDCVEKLDGVTITLPELTLGGKFLTATVGDVTVTSVVPSNQNALRVQQSDLDGTAATGSNAVRVLELSASDLVTVSFAANGGEGEMEAVKLAKGYYTLPASEFNSPEGKQFKCWAVDGPDGETVDAFTTILVENDTTFYALWEDTPLTFVDNRSYDVPLGEVGTNIKPIDLSVAVTGGTAPYVFSLKEEDSWLEITENGVLSGHRPMELQNAREVVICVKDAAENQAEITIRVGEVVATAPKNDQAAIRIGTTGLVGGLQQRRSCFGTVNVPMSRVYFGQYDDEPIFWRVLDSEKDNTGNAGGVFLFSENYMGKVDLSTKNGPKDWCSSFANGDGLSTKEQEAVRSVTKKDWPINEFGWDNWQESRIEDEQVFFLSPYELEEYVSSFDEWDLLGTGNSRRGTWLLRTPMVLSGNREAIGAVNGMDYVNYKELKDGASAYARPALNVEQGKVLFVSALGALQKDTLYDRVYHAPGAKAGRNFGVKQVEVKSSDDWKLTLLDESRRDFTASMEGNVVTYQNATVGKNEYITALVCDMTGTITHYGRLCHVESPSGSVTVDLTGINMEGKSLHIINEQYNGGRSDDTLTTDYASPMVWVAGVREYDVTIEGAEGGTGYANPSSAMPGMKVTLSAEPDAGYGFVGWEIVEGDLELCDDNTFLMPEEDVVLQPVFERVGGTDITDDSVLITFDAQGGSVHPDCMWTNGEGHLTDAPRASRAGYRFLGWFTTPNFGGERVTAETLFVRNTTVYARWHFVEINQPVNPSVPSVPEDTVKVEILHIAPDGTVTAEVTVPNKMGEVVVTIPKDNAASGDVAVIVSPNGSETVVPNSILTDGGIQIVLSGKTTVRIENRAKRFADVPENHWAYDPVSYVTARGLFNGVSAAEFAPGQSLTRAMLATVLYHLEGDPTVGGSVGFSDVPAGQWYTDAVLWAAGEGIVTGYGDGRFGPNDHVTREQLAAMLYRYAVKMGQGFRGAWMFPLNYPDASSVSQYAYEAMCWCTMKGIITGMGDGTLNPQGTATRAEAATMLMRFMQSAVKDSMEQR